MIYKIICKVIHKVKSIVNAIFNLDESDTVCFNCGQDKNSEEICQHCFEQEYGEVKRK